MGQALDVFTALLSYKKHPKTRCLRSSAERTSGSGAGAAGVGEAWAGWTGRAGMGSWGAGADDMAMCSAGVDRGTMGASVGAGVVGDTSWAWAWVWAAGTGGLGGSAAGLPVWGCMHEAKTLRSSMACMQSGPKPFNAGAAFQMGRHVGINRARGCNRT